ncbi:general transcription factor IIH subunit 2-like isoform X2 [Xenia sp. Carnegie-2017]|uniref:general transcription factor IIH subunit 2-like isoform X2 n=1 Tax=Xenia sp. Carnegie-2017 TaxID=2897299 RepID=UPI001F0345C7|nr:general transcription factor IIH subunit 2-like isoform X2 [Xenia sp. Carnegie-2017]
MAHDDEEEAGYRWLNQYEKTWEAIQEDAQGGLQFVDDDFIQRAKRRRFLAKPGNIRLGMMRHLYVILDLSKAMEEADLKPSRIVCTIKLGIIVTFNKRAEKLTELSGNPRLHTSALLKKEKPNVCQGQPSLQNALETAKKSLRHLPGHASREILVVFGSLTTCDPGDVMETFESLKEFKIRCSIIGLAAEVKVCKKLSATTDGTYDVILDEKHYRDVLMQHVIPPAAKVDVEAALIKMGFPRHIMSPTPSLCLCHVDGEWSKDVNRSGYFCPQCDSKFCELPVQCKTCGLTLVSAPHLARSFQHLFPLPQFTEVTADEQSMQKNCSGCDSPLGKNLIYECPECCKRFCFECDLFIHETLHVCPGCTSSVDKSIETA